MNSAQQILHSKFAELKRKNSRFTLRAFAARLGVSSGALSEMLSGRRKLTVKAAEKLAIKLALSPAEKAKFTNATPIKQEFAQLSQDQFHLISDWWHFAILNLIETRDFKNDLDWMASRLLINRSLVEAALERLKRLGMIVASGKSLKRKEARYETTDEVLDLSIRRAHQADLELVQKSLDQDDHGVRDMTSITFPLDPSQLKEAKAFIRTFQDQFIERFGTPEASEVYRMSLQLFPLTKR
jgi:uncharacterized protein (TIGR02147 family)